MQKTTSCGVGILPALAWWQAYHLPHKKMYAHNEDTPDFSQHLYGLLGKKGKGKGLKG